MLSPSEYLALLDTVGSLGAWQCLCLLIGIVFSVLSHYRSRLPSPLRVLINKATATAVWEICWLCLPNALVSYLFPSGPYIIKKTSNNSSIMSMAFSRYLKEPKATQSWDVYSILLVAFTAFFLFSGLISYFFQSPQECTPAPASPTPPATCHHVLLLPPKDISTLKSLMHRVGLKIKFTPVPPHSVAEIFDELLSLCPAHLKTWLIYFVDSRS